MAYGMNQLRKAGKALMDVDEAYSRALIPKNFPDQFGQATRGLSMRDIVSTDLSQVKGFGAKPIAIASLGGLGVANVAARYGLPAGGITLAGKGLMDLTGMFVGENEQTSGTLMP